MKEYLHFIQRGNQKGPLVILLHGFTGSCEEFIELITPFEKDFNFALIDLPGHGKSLNLEDYTPAFVFKQLEIISNGRKICCLAGYSMGGRVALHYALKHPGLVDKLVLESSSAGIDDEAERAARRKSDQHWIDYLNSHSIEEFLQAWYEQAIFSDLKKNTQSLEMLIGQKKNNAPVELAKALQHMGQSVMPGLWQELHHLTSKTWLLCGALDEKYLAIHEKMLNRVPHARRIVFNHAKHNIHFAQPVEFASRLKEILYE